MYTKGRCTKSHAECPLIHNPTCQWHKADGCRDGAKCLFPHRATGRVVAVQQTPSKRLIKAKRIDGYDGDPVTAQEAVKNEGKPKVKAKAKAKAKGKAEK